MFASIPRPVGAATQTQAQYNELCCLAVIQRFGHARGIEVARSVWPDSPRGAAQVSAGKVLARLVRKGQILERPDGLPGHSYVLCRRGVLRLGNVGIKARNGLGLSLGSIHLWHRVFGARYLIERAVKERCEVYGEYAIEQGNAPLLRGETFEICGKLPDGLVVTRPRVLAGLGVRSCAGVLDWIEVEHRGKRPEASLAMLRMAFRSGERLNVAESWRLGRVYLVYNGKAHERALLRGLTAMVAPLAEREKNRVLGAIVFVRCVVELPLAWVSYEEIPAAVLMVTAAMPAALVPAAPRGEHKPAAAPAARVAEVPAWGADADWGGWSGDPLDDVVAHWEEDCEARQKQKRALEKFLAERKAREGR